MQLKSLTNWLNSLTMQARNLMRWLSSIDSVSECAEKPDIAWHPQTASFDGKNAKRHQAMEQVVPEQHSSHQTIGGWRPA